MDKRTVFLSTAQARQTAHRYVDEAPSDWVMVLSQKTRSLEQNALLWSVLTDLSKQCEWVVNGASVKLPAEEVKIILTAALKREQRMALVPGGGIVMLGQSTSKMPKAQMSELITLGHALGDERGVVWSPTSLGRSMQEQE